MSFFDYINDIYTKRKIKVNSIELYEIVTLIKWLAFDKNNLSVLSKVLEYVWYLEPINLYYLLYFLVPRRTCAPFIKKIAADGISKKDIELLAKIKRELGWTEREFEQSQELIKNVYLPKRAYWKGKLGIGKDGKNN